MANGRTESIVEQLQRTVQRQQAAGLTDGQLLERFVSRHDEAAFEALVKRHGRMVWAVCQRILRHAQDAEDAFQATFLVLARKAASVVPRERVGNWLYGVAHTTAIRARTINLRRRARQRPLADVPATACEPPNDPSHLDQELSRLPAKYREVIVLCDLEERTRKEVARQLQVPEGTVSSRLNAGRRMLARRLKRHGLVLPAGAVAALTAPNLGACPAASLTAATVRIAALVAKTKAAGAVSTQVAHLMEGVLRTMLVTKLKLGAAILVLTVCAGFGIALLTHEAAGQPLPADKPRTGKPSLATTRAGADLRSLQGVWKVVSMESNGQRVDGTDGDEFVIMIRGNRVCLQTTESEVQGGIYLDPTSRPKAYDIATHRRTWAGIYSLDGDTLRLCYGQAEDAEAERPDSFRTRPGDRRVCLTLKREKDMDISDFRLPDGSRAFPTLVEKANQPPQPPPRLAEPTEPAPPPVPPPVKAPRIGGKDSPPRVGQIIIVGNEKTPDALVRMLVEVYPGQVLDYRALQTAEEKLRQCDLFVVDREKGVSPTVTVVENADSEFRDILVSVQERKGRGERKSTPEARGTREFDVADFYARAGHPGAAIFYYELVCRRYPASSLAAQARKRMERLKSSTQK